MPTLTTTLDGSDIACADAGRAHGTRSTGDDRAVPHRTPVQALRACRGSVVALPYLSTPALVLLPRSGGCREACPVASSSALAMRSS